MGGGLGTLPIEVFATNCVLLVAAAGVQGVQTQCVNHMCSSGQ
jgi:hypothetical protein